MNTKNILVVLMILIAVGCQNKDWEFDDYPTQGCYFPYQTPVRTLILGKYDQGINENDNNHRFEITAILTGLYSNKEDRQIHFEIDNSLLTNVANVKALPVQYYTFETLSPITISAGSTKAKIMVQLRDEFFKDNLAFGSVNTTNYVIPVRMTKVVNIDSIYTGISYSDIANPDRLNPDHWDTPAKDYTLFGIKFMNKFHGNYLRRGIDNVTSGTPYVARKYHEIDVVKDEVIFVATSGDNKVHLANIIGRGDNESPGSVNMELTFKDDNTCTISSYDEDPYSVSGTGKYIEEGDEWGDQKRDVVYLDYTYIDVANLETHSIKDTIVMRDRAAVFEEFEVELKKED